MQQESPVKYLSAIGQFVEPGIHPVIVFGQQVMGEEPPQEGIENDSVFPQRHNPILPFSFVHIGEFKGSHFALDRVFWIGKITIILIIGIRVEGTP
jgi:hypothetical protein